MCGKKVGTRRHLVEGTTMNLCISCGKYGTPLDSPAPQGSQAAVVQNLERRAAKHSPRSVYGEETWDLVQDYGKRIRSAREKKGLSYDQLGNKVQARVPELQHIEANKLRPSDDLCRRLEKELGIVLLEKAQPSEVVSGTPKPAGKAGLTIGDLLQDALKGKK